MSPPWRSGKRVAIAGGGPGAISTGLAFLQRGYDVRIFEKQRTCQAIGGAVLLSIPVLAILRAYGLTSDNFGSYTRTTFANKWGKERVQLPFNTEVERRMGIQGWQYGVLRSTIFGKMLELVPEGVIYTDHEVIGYEEKQQASGEEDTGVQIRFKNGSTMMADILVAADGIRSTVSRQAFGEPGLFHTGIRVWLAWCDQIPGIPAHHGVISHDWQYQASFFPMMREGNRPGFEWWVVEPSYEDKPAPADPRAHLAVILQDWAQPMPRLLEATDFRSQVYRWEVYNRSSLQKWSTGRVVGVGDAVHPVSPYAAYGMGMAIEDGYYLARAFDGVDLRDRRAVAAGFEVYEQQRVDYANHHMEFARFSGSMFHRLPWPLAKVRDLIFDYTPVLGMLLKKDYLQRAEEETMNLRELQVV
ncbi:salicylate hydroxylase [Aspergillus uvarum CBS 121591]|uniref:Salicylate hydroxylase n=1 Tax=Aspergillus uvarum CBS 121591 TaxID=1448315 RepID=A0A319CWU7_9EURO|nr:salicylate hydroxylase [Aspergillus uvarum CBS 121591]PYH80118.1 salicylate hydroxylase [Aspergillus uvarum CBS 121591]